MATWELEGRYQIRLLETDGTLLRSIDEYITLEYLKNINGLEYNGWGSYTLRGERSLLPVSDFTLDRLVSVRRKAPGSTTWDVDFEGLHRRRRRYTDEADNEMYESSGTDIRSLLRRRIILPPTGQDLLSIKDHYTDIMRYLVWSQAVGGPAARAITNLVVEADSHEGAILPLNFRYTHLDADLEALAGVGADFDIVRSGSALTFQVGYPRFGEDRRIGNTDGNLPVIFSEEQGNLISPNAVFDRLNEINTAYVGGEGIGADREIVLRTHWLGTANDSIWNRIESFIDSGKESNTAALMAQGDALLAERAEKIEFTCQVLPVPGCLYGVHWNVGDLATTVYDDVNYDVRIIEVHITVQHQGESLHEEIMPTLQLYREPWP